MTSYQTPRPNHNRTDYNAAFHLSSTVVHSKHSLESVMNGFEILAAAQRLPNGLAQPDTSKIVSDSSAIDSLTSISAALTAQHELHHYRESMATTFGLFNWRLMSCMLEDVRWLCIAAKRVRGIKPVRGSIIEWALSNPWEDIVPETAQIPDSLREAFSDPRDYCSHMVTQMKYVLMAVQGQQYFRSVLMDNHPELSMVQFVALANWVFEYLGERCDIDDRPQWTSRMLGSSSYLPEGAMSGDEIFEGAARLEEFRILSESRVTNHVVDSWLRESIFGVYEPAFTQLLRNLQWPQVALLLVDQALMGTMDICCGTQGELIYVEDVLPQWRLTNLIEGARDLSWPSARGDVASVIESELYPRSGLQSPSTLLRNLSLRSLNGPDGWRLSVGGPAVDHLSFNLGRIADALRRRIDDPLHVVWPTRLNDLQPVLEIYSDSLHTDQIYLDEPTRHGPSVMYNAYVSFVLDTALFSLLSGEDLDQLRSIETAVLDALPIDLPSERLESWTVARIFSNLPDGELWGIWDDFPAPA